MSVLNVPSSVIVAAMVVGPGEADRYLDRALANAATWSDLTVVYADHVDRATRYMLRHARTHVFPSRFDAPTFLEDESYVRNKLLEALDGLLSDGDIVVILDADEELYEPLSGPRKVLKGLQRDGSHQAWSGYFYHLWDDEGSKMRIDGGWRPAPQFRVYRHVGGARIEQRVMACAAIPSSAIPRAPTSLRFLHWGYAREEDRQAKFDRYMRVDAGRFHSLAHLRSIVGTPTLAPN